MTALNISSVARLTATSLEWSEDPSLNEQDPPFSLIESSADDETDNPQENTEEDTEEGSPAGEAPSEELEDAGFNTGDSELDSLLEEYGTDDDDLSPDAEDVDDSEEDTGETEDGEDDDLNSVIDQYDTGEEGDYDESDDGDFVNQSEAPQSPEPAEPQDETPENPVEKFDGIPTPIPEETVDEMVDYTLPSQQDLDMSIWASPIFAAARLEITAVTRAQFDKWDAKRQKQYLAQHPTSMFHKQPAPNSKGGKPAPAGNKKGKPATPNKKAAPNSKPNKPAPKPKSSQGKQQSTNNTQQNRQDLHQQKLKQQQEAHEQRLKHAQEKHERELGNGGNAQSRPAATAPNGASVSQGQLNKLHEMLNDEAVDYYHKNAIAKLLHRLTKGKPRGTIQRKLTRGQKKATLQKAEAAMTNIKRVLKIKQKQLNRAPLDQIDTLEAQINSLKQDFNKLYNYRANVKVN